MFSPSGKFIEQVIAISVSQIPRKTISYINKNYIGATVTEAGKFTDAGGKISYEAEGNEKEVFFDEKGNFLKVE